MQSVFIAYDQAHHEAILEILERNSCRGFTSFGEVYGRGSVKGEPHYGTHAWPSIGGAILTIVEDSRLQHVLDALKALDDSKPKLGLRAFVWPVTSSI